MAKTIAATSPEILEAALLGLESQRDKLDEQIAQVRSLLGRKAGRPARVAASTTSSAVRTAKAPAGIRVLSEEARKRIAAAQKKRWAAFRKIKK
jgi:uncharacterized protein with von Willebrand factor type A (vWA) domain